VSAPHPPAGRPGGGRPDDQPDIDQPDIDQPDIALLAEYAGGLLDATSDGAAVERRVASDTQWAAALDNVRTAVRSSTARLRSLDDVDPTGPLPADVADRIAAALRAAAATPNAAAAGTADGTADGTGAASTGTGATVLHLDRSRRRRTGVLGGAAAAALVLLAGTAFGTSLLRGQALDSATAPEVGGRAGVAASEGEDRAGPTGRQGSNDAEAPAADATAQQPPTAGPDGAVVTASGTDYDDASLARFGRDAARQDVVKGSVTQPPAPKTPLPVDLARFADQRALNRCVDAVRATTGGRPLRIDLARYRGAAAVVVALTAPARQVRVVVAGPACGSPGVDEVTSTLVTP